MPTAASMTGLCPVRCGSRRGRPWFLLLRPDAGPAPRPAGPDRGPVPLARASVQADRPQDHESLDHRLPRSHAEPDEPPRELRDRGCGVVDERVELDAGPREGLEIGAGNGGTGRETARFAGHGTPWSRGKRW